MKDRKLRGIINKVANRNQVAPDLLEDAFDFTIKATKRKLEDPRMPKVLWHNFGSFKVKRGRIEYKIKYYINKYRKGIANLEDTQRKVKELWEVRKRIVKEDNSKKHKK